MKTYTLKTFLVVFGLFSSSNSLLAQDPFSFDVKFLRAKFTDTTQNKDLIAVFILSTSDSSNFPPIVNIPPKFSILFSDHEEKIQLTPEILSVSFDDDKIILKNMPVYEIIRDKVNLNVKHPIMIISYRMKDISTKDFNKIAMSISFSEKKDKSKRYEKRFEVPVDK